MSGKCGCYLTLLVSVLASVSVQMRNITETLMKPLEKFRKEHLGTVRVMAVSLFFCAVLKYITVDDF